MTESERLWKRAGRVILIGGFVVGTLVGAASGAAGAILWLVGLGGWALCLVARRSSWDLSFLITHTARYKAEYDAAYEAARAEMGLDDRDIHV